MMTSMMCSMQEEAVSVILQRAANRQGGLAAAAATRNATAEGNGQPQLHKNSFKCSKCHRVGLSAIFCNTILEESLI